MQMTFDELSQELATMGMRVLMTTIADGKEIAIVEKLKPDTPMMLTRPPDPDLLNKALDICKKCQAFDPTTSNCTIAEIGIGRLISTGCPIDKWPLA